MKIKRNYYCISDKNNKPDFRYLFEDAADARRKIRSIKNSTKGETLFYANNKRDFFVDGVRKDLICPEKKVRVKRGCWTALQVKPLQLFDTINPEQMFEKIIPAEEHRYEYTKQQQMDLPFRNGNLHFPLITNPLKGFDITNSLLHTKAFVFALGFLCMATISSVLYINHSSATIIEQELVASQRKSTEKTVAFQAEMSKNKDQMLAGQFSEDMNKFVLETMQHFSNLKQEDFENEIRKLIAGSPMERMAPYIAQQDRTVAAFLVGIAKKESDFGRHVPVLNGQDCFNYWGYRGIRARMGTGGHTCFNSPEDAVNTVAGRIRNLVQSDVDTPGEMVLWKCGSACSADPMAGKWINDVTLYFSKLEKTPAGDRS